VDGITRKDAVNNLLANTKNIKTRKAVKIALSVYLPINR